MKLGSTAILLFVTLLIVPIISYFFGTSLGNTELQALQTLIIIAIIAIAYSFIVGDLTLNNSQVDKLWSILPIIYVWVVAAYGNFTPRLLIMAFIVSFWGIRLTTNFALKGAYQWRFWTGEEDYRWKYLREKPEFKPRWKWMLFNLFFISFYQHSLILLFTLPSLIVLQNANTPLGIADIIVAVCMLFFIIYEMIADIQHWKYQSKKWSLINKREALYDDYKKGILDKGLWAYSRHPNYFAEQAIWICFYFFSVAAGGQWINWTIAGCLLLVVLFQGSANLSESISAEKYIDYKDYQQKVPRFIPFLSFNKK
jgi:steroid 5-alpha reductase family enzyme